jgi:predicted RNase H-like HicB family nuclease
MNGRCLTTWLNITLPVRLEPHEEGGFTAICPSIHGCVSTGSNYTEALSNLREEIAMAAEEAVAQAEAADAGVVPT